MKRIFKSVDFTLIWILILIISPLLSLTWQEARGAFPIVANYNKKVYKGGAKNWQVEQDSTGRIYIANQYALLIYNGNLWQRHYLDNYSEVRSIALDYDNNRIFAGGSGTFGYFSPDSVSGVLAYHSLVPTLSDPSKRIGDIWNILKCDDGWWIQGDNDFFRFDGRNTIVIPVGEKIMASGVVDGKLIFATEKGLLYKMNGHLVSEVSQVMSGKIVKRILQHPLSSRKGIVVTAFSGCYIMEGDNVEPIQTPIDPMLRQSQVFSAYARDKKILLGTVNNGAILYDFTNGDVSIANRETGVQNNTVLSTYIDFEGNGWLGLDNGISFVLYNSPIKLLLPMSASVGSGYSSSRWRDKMVLGTNQGLFAIDYPEMAQSSALSFPFELHGQIWKIQQDGDKLLVSSDLGLYYGVPGSWQKIEPLGGVLGVTFLDRDHTKMIVAAYNDYYFATRSPSGWSIEGNISGFPNARGELKIDDEGYLWRADWQKGIFRMRFDDQDLKFTNVVNFTQREGLGATRGNTVDILDGKALISGDGGFYVPSGSGDNAVMVNDEEHNKIFPFYMSMHVNRDSDSMLWGLSRDKLAIARKGNDGYMLDTLTYHTVPRNLIPGYVDMNFLDDAVIMSSEEGFYELDPNYDASQGWHPSLFLSQVYIDGDSLIYSKGSLGIEVPKIRLPYKASSVRFMVALPEYREENSVIYSFMLEGLDNQWSPYTPVPAKEYSRLGHGSYKLRVRALDLYDNERYEAEYSVVVNTPWYFSTVVIIIYVIIALALLAGIVTLVMSNTRKSVKRVEAIKEEEIKVIKEAALEESRKKDSEIESLEISRKEQEKSHRTEFLSNMTMNTVQKNEILQKIGDKLGVVQTSLVIDSPKNAEVARLVESLQKEIQNSLQKEEDQAAISQNFERVYGDYAERLVEKFPDLTKSEIRLCCYIKMGLSTKEIAPLINVAAKTVEMSRYRLRKKLNLDRRDNLSEFLANF